jgi:hypothetical protein
MDEAAERRELGNYVDISELPSSRAPNFEQLTQERKRKLLELEREEKAKVAQFINRDHIVEVKQVVSLKFACGDAFTKLNAWFDGVVRVLGRSLPLSSLPSDRPRFKGIPTDADVLHAHNVTMDALREHGLDPEALANPLGSEVDPTE